jgi:hypothetical protein
MTISIKNIMSKCSIYIFNSSKNSKSVSVDTPVKTKSFRVVTKEERFRSRSDKYSFLELGAK